MNIIIALICIDTIVQLFVCHFSLWWIIAFVCRLLFCCRIIGATFKVKNLAIGECVAFAAMLIFNMLFHNEGLPWVRLLLFALFSALSIGLMFLDDALYVYIVKDVEDD